MFFQLVMHISGGTPAKKLIAKNCNFNLITNEV